MRFFHTVIFGISVVCIVTSFGCARPANVAVAGHPSIVGTWFIELQTNDVGYVRTVMTFEQRDSAFEAYSREGAASETVGWFKLLMAKIFTHYFSHGALLHFIDGHVASGTTGDNKIIHATFASALGDMEFAGTFNASTMQGTLSDNGRIVGSVRGSRTVPAMPLEDYSALVERMRTTTEERIYDARQLHSDAWNHFIATLKEGAAQSQDDADMIFKFFQASRSLPFTHFYMFATPPDSMNSVVAAKANANAAITLNGLHSGGAVLRIRTFAGDARPIDSCFEQIVGAHDSVLVIDLRGNSGGNVSAMRVAAHIADRSYDGGAFVTRKWFDAHGAAPTHDQMIAFPELSQANLELLYNGIHTQDGLALRLKPDSLHYAGRVYILVDKGTASACEPLVYALQQNKLATIVGENTAGAMLNGEQFAVGGQWKLTVPTADFFTADGVRLDRRGVAPDIAVKSADAMNEVKKRIASPSK